MKISDYEKLALRTINKTINNKDLLIEAQMGISGESGEFTDSLKKHFFQGHELDKEHLKEELGDIIWYICSAANALDLTLEEVMMTNIKKLQRRYPEGFDKDRSINREP